MNNEYCSKCNTQYDSDFQSCNCDSGTVDHLNEAPQKPRDMTAMNEDIKADCRETIKRLDQLLAKMAIVRPATTIEQASIAELQDELNKAANMQTTKEARHALGKTQAFLVHVRAQSQKEINDAESGKYSSTPGDNPRKDRIVQSRLRG